MLRWFLLAVLFASTSGYTLSRVPSRACASMKAAAFVTGGTVKVISGDSKGTVAKLLSIDKGKGQVVVEGVNVKTKHVKPMKEGESGKLLKKEMPIHISNVAPVDAPADAPAPAAAE